MTTLIEFQVIGDEKIHCSGCETRIGFALCCLPGVRDVRTSAETQRVEVAIDPSAVSADEVRAKLEQLGYQVHKAVSAIAKLDLKVGGMACALCVASIGKHLGGMRGVRNVDVSLAREEVLIEFEPHQVTPAELKNAFLDLGFTVRAAHKLASFRRIAFGVAMALLALAALALWQSQWDMSPLEAWVEAHAVLGAVAYLVAVAASVVLLPLSSLPFLPIAAHLYGVWLTGLLSAAGWWIGSLIAFQIARLGRRYLERFASLDTVDRLERRIPGDVGFGGIVVLRMILPVDIVSFALGLLKELRFSTYAIASLIGILPFAFVLSYAGGELGAGRFLTFGAVAVGMTAAVLVIRRLWGARQRQRRSSK